MRVTIRQKNLDITPALHVYIDSKVLKPVRRLLQYTKDSALPVLDLEFERSTMHHKKGKVFRAEATLTLNGRRIRAAVGDEDIRACCDRLKEELERGILNYKSKKTAISRRVARSVKKSLRLDPLARKSRGARDREEG